MFTLMVIHMALENAWLIITIKEMLQNYYLIMETPVTWRIPLNECSFYGRDWERDEEPAREYRDEWMYMDAIKGDIFIEYIYYVQK